MIDVYIRFLSFIIYLSRKKQVKSIEIYNISYIFLIISLIRIAFGALGLFVFSIPIFGFLYFAVIGEIPFHISIIYGIILLFLLSLF